MNKVSLALLTFILANCQVNTMESPLARLTKAVKHAERLSFALKVANYGLVGLIGWNLASLSQNSINKNVEKNQIGTYEEGKKEGFIQGKCNVERILWDFWRRTEYGNYVGFSVQESQKWQSSRQKAGQEYFDCRKQHEKLATELASKI